MQQYRPTQRKPARWIQPKFVMLSGTEILASPIAWRAWAHGPSQARHKSLYISGTLILTAWTAQILPEFGAYRLRIPA